MIKGSNVSSTLTGLLLNQLFIEPEISLRGTAQALLAQLLQINGSVASVMGER
jgi:hypothetical protein